jgi:hypothetical protein
MATPLSLSAVRPAQNEAGGSQVAGGTARYARTVFQSVLSTDLCWTIPSGLPLGAHLSGPAASGSVTFSG